MEYERGVFDIDETYEGEWMPAEFKVRRLTEEGLGFGEGDIKGSPEGLDPTVRRAVDAAINSNEILVPIDKDDEGQTIDDDGCGDGRGVRVVYKANKIFKRSLNRAKVFGGGVVMGMAMLLGTGRALGRNLEEVAGDSINMLDENGIDYGAHNASHVGSEADCGCGAIDKKPAVIRAVVKYRSEITATMAVLLDLQAESNSETKSLVEKDIDTVFSNYEAYAPSLEKQKYSGRNVFGKIVNRGKVTKELEGAHTEIGIVLNKVRGFTVNQDLIRRVSGGKAQVFGVDVWRLEDLAAETHPADPNSQRLAMIAELIHTLAISAVLTDGKQTVDVIEPEYSMAA
jgi:hypothetical protein